MIDATHDPALVSWVESANDPATDFPIQNLPFGVFGVAAESARTGVAIGDRILDVAEALGLSLFEGESERAAAVCGDACRCQSRVPRRVRRGIRRW